MAGLNVRSLCIVAAALLFGACGGEEPDHRTEIKRSTLNVAADPPGHTFTDSVWVELESEASAAIYYTLDGTSPAGEDGILYDGPILIEEDALLTFIAVDGDRWSQPVTELYEKDEPLPEPKLLGRALSVDDDTLVFSARGGDPGTMRKTVRVQSVGLQRVRIENIYISFHPESWSFWEEGVFEMESELETPTYLHPGESLELTVTYTPTETIRTGLLVIQSDDQRSEEGYVLIDLMGRIWNW